MGTELAKAYVQIIPSARGIKGEISKQISRKQIRQVSPSAVVWSEQSKVLSWQPESEKQYLHPSMRELHCSRVSAASKHSLKTVLTK